MRFSVDGEYLIYDAPQGVMTPADLAQLRKHKSELLAYLNREAANTIADPDGSCSACSFGQWWQLPGEPWHCRICEPDMPLTATTFTLPCHKEQVPPAGPHAGLERMIETSCKGLIITPEQLRQELEEGGDLPDLVSGALAPQALRLTAKTLALMRCSPEGARHSDNGFFEQLSRTS